MLSDRDRKAIVVGIAIVLALGSNFVWKRIQFNRQQERAAARRKQERAERRRQWAPIEENMRRMDEVIKKYERGDK